MRRSIRISAYCLVALTLLVATLGAVVLVGGNTEAGRGLIERLTSSLTGGHVKLSGLAGAFPTRLILRQLQLSDDRGVWLSAERLAVRWEPLVLLRRRILIDSLQVSRLHIERAPVAGSSDRTGTASIPHIDALWVSIDRLELGAPLVGAAAALSVQGGVRLRSLEDASVNIVARRIDGDGTYALRARFDSKRVEGALSVHEPVNGPLENFLTVPGLGALSVEGHLRGPREAARVDVTVAAGALRGRAAGSVDLKRRSANVGFSLAASAMAPSPTIAWNRVELQGRWQGPVTAPTADGHLQAEALRLPGGTALDALHATLTAAGGTLRVRAVIDGVHIPGPQPQLLKDDPATIDASIRLDDAARPVELSATHRLFSLHANAVTNGQQALTLELRLPDLMPFAALLGQDVRGEGEIKAKLTRGTDLRMTLDAGAAFAGGTAAWLGALGDRATLQLTGTLNDRALAIERLRLTGRALVFTMSGNAFRAPPSARPVVAKARAAGIGNIKNVHAQWDLDLSDLGTLSPALAGKLSGSGEINGAPTALVADAQLTSSLSVRGSPSGRVSAVVHAQGLPGASTGTLLANGDLDGAPVSLDLALVQTGRGPNGGLPTGVGALRAVVRRADWKTVHAEGDLMLAAAAAESRGQFRFTLGELSDLDRLLGTALQGHVEGTVEFQPVGGRAHANVRLTARDVVAGPVAGSAQLSGEGPVEALAMQLAVKLPALRGAPATLAATAQLNLDSREIRFAAASVGYRGETVRLLSPASLSFADGISLGSMTLGEQQALLTIGGRVTPALDLHASLRGLGPALINTMAPAPLAAGTIDADADLQGSFAAPIGHLRLEGRGLRAANDAGDGLPALTMKGTAELTGNAATVDASLSAGSSSLLSVTGGVPLNAQGVFGLKIAGKLDVGLANPLLEAGGQHASGVLSIDATVTGDAGAPQIGGTLRLAEGSLRDYALGVNLSKISGEIEGTEAMLQIKTLTASAATGTVSMSGTIGVLQPGLPLDLKITAKNAEPIVSQIVTANLDADLRVSGKARERVEVAGSIHVNRATIGIPNTLPPNVAVLDVRRRGQAPPAAAEQDVVIGLDVKVQAPQQILVQGRGLDAELGGDLHLGGTTDAPVVSGGFDLQRGTFSLASSKLSFTAGRVSFDGAGLKNRIDPSLDFTAETVVADTTATLKITGYADSPRFDFTSSSSLPQDEILARLLFGVSAAQLSALQVASIGVALANLSGVGDSGLNPLAKLQKSLGLDRLAVGSGTTTSPTGTTTNAGAAIEAGRYISRRVYLEAKQTTQGTSQVQVDVDLSKHLKLQTRLGNGTAIVQGTTPENDPGSSIGLSYQFEY
jgi:translocation and assembly module TamB